MSAFKEQVEADIAEVFINTDEFADEHDINGTVVNAVFQELDTEEYLSRAYAQNLEGITGQTFVLHVKKSDLPDAIVDQNVIYVDGEPYRVNQTTDDMGMLTMILEVETI